MNLPSVLIKALLVTLAMVPAGETLRAQPSNHASVPVRKKEFAVTLTIGGGDEKTEAKVFETISGLDLATNGDIFVSDLSVNEVHVFNGMGEFKYAIGRKGRGPGDLSNPCCIALTEGNRLWVREMGNRRLSVFDVGNTSARFLRSVPTQSNVGSFDRISFSKDGNILDVKSVPARHDSPDLRMVRLFLNSTGSIVESDTVPSSPTDSLDQETFVSKGGFSTYSTPFGAKALRTFGPSGMAAYAVSTNYQVRLVDSHGKVIADIQRLSEPIPLSKHETWLADSMIDRIAKNTSRARAEMKMQPPRNKPVIAGMSFDLDGRLWIERSVREGQPHLADVYNSMGKLVTMVQWPADVDLSFRTVRGNVALGTSQDSDGQPQVVRLGLRK